MGSDEVNLLQLLVEFLVITFSEHGLHHLDGLSLGIYEIHDVVSLLVDVQIDLLVVVDGQLLLLEVESTGPLLEVVSAQEEW